MSSIMNSITLKHGIRALTSGPGPAAAHNTVKHPRPTLVLLPGWPQDAEAFLPIIPALLSHGYHQILALDPPGLGYSSAPPANNYSTASISKALHESIEEFLGTNPEPFHLVGHDIGAWIAYAWAAQYPASVKSLTLMDAMVPGLSPAQSYPLKKEVNYKLWQFSFYSLPGGLPEILTKGREGVLFDWLFDTKSVHPERIGGEARRRYVEIYEREGATGRVSEYYKAFAESTSENLERFGKTGGKSRLEMPVLGLGGTGGVGEGLRKSLEGLAKGIVRGGAVEDCGHYMMEEQPEVVGRELLTFFEEVEGRSEGR